MVPGAGLWTDRQWTAEREPDSNFRASRGSGGELGHLGGQGGLKARIQREMSGRPEVPHCFVTGTGIGGPIQKKGPALRHFHGAEVQGLPQAVERFRDARELERRWAPVQTCNQMLLAVRPNAEGGASWAFRITSCSNPLREFL